MKTPTWHLFTLTSIEDCFKFGWFYIRWNSHVTSFHLDQYRGFFQARLILFSMKTPTWHPFTFDQLKEGKVQEVGNGDGWRDFGRHRFILSLISFQRRPAFEVNGASRRWRSRRKSREFGEGLGPNRGHSQGTLVHLWPWVQASDTSWYFTHEK